MVGVQDYITILKCVESIPFPVGKNLLSDILRGEKDNESIMRNKLFTMSGFGSMAYGEDELRELLDEVERKGWIAQKTVAGKKFWKVFHITDKGRAILKDPAKIPTKEDISVQPTCITDDDRRAFVAFGDFLASYNDAQKKAIIHPSPHILCIAGAGSGKTTVLTKRIEYLIRYKSVAQNTILAITFTRKARGEMIRRLTIANILGVHVHTFNSFCEQLLREHGHLIYNKPMQVMTYKDRFKLVRAALDKYAISPSRAVYLYFTPGQRRSKSHDQLFAILVNDLFFILDYYKSHGKDVEDFSTQAKDQTSAQIIYRLCKYLERAKQERGYRDFMDQLVDGLHLLKHFAFTCPTYEHILIDEYQDVNDLQIELLKILNAPHSFVVGDPRQAIYGWRGSRVQHILDRIHDHDVINLTQNYRSLTPIVNFMNEAIAPMHLAPLESPQTGDCTIHLIGFADQNAEIEFILHKIIDLSIPREEIFILARTNKQLNEVSQLLKSKHIAHVVRSDEIHKSVHANPGELTLATIHAIKGLEAEVVFVIGCSSTNFPCKGSEHPVIDLIKVDTYDPEEEERRLFYVAISRAKSQLYMTYSTKRRTTYITDAMMAMVEKKIKRNIKCDSIQGASAFDSVDTTILSRLKQWRRQTADIMNMPAYIILHDATLEEVAKQKPSTIEELLAIKGFGPAKIHQYGEAILKVVKK